jgi:hypothetical protein
MRPLAVPRLGGASRRHATTSPPPSAVYRWRPGPPAGRVREAVGSNSTTSSAGGGGSAAPPGEGGVRRDPFSAASSVASDQYARLGAEAGVSEAPGGGARAPGPEASGSAPNADASNPGAPRPNPPPPASYAAAAATAAAAGGDPWAWVPRDVYSAAAVEAGLGEAERAAAVAAEAAVAAAAAGAASEAASTRRPDDGWTAAARAAPPPAPPPSTSYDAYAADASGWEAGADAAARARVEELEEDWGGAFGASFGGGGGPRRRRDAPPRRRPAAPRRGREDDGNGAYPPPSPPRWAAARPGDGRASQGVGSSSSGWGADPRAAAPPPPSEPDPAAPPPDITPLSPAEADALLPFTPQPDQVRAFNADGAALVQRVGASLLVTLACVKAPAAAAGALTAPLWWPLARAALRNRGLRRGDPPVGLWRARVLEAGFEAGGGGGGALAAAPGSLRLLVGDDSGARTLVVAPYEARRHAEIRVGDAAELVVLGRGGPPGSGPAAFVRGFRALPEAYLPETGQWVGAGYPYVDRRAAMRLSVLVEEERRQGEAEVVEEEAGAWV